MYYRGYGLGPCGGWGPGGWGPSRLRNRFGHDQAPIDIAESETDYTIKVFAPSADKDKIQLSTQNDILWIRYNGGDKPDRDRFTRSEFRRDSIDRSFDLKGKVDTERINAKYAEGVLTIVLPKNDNARRPAQQVPIS